MCIGVDLFYGILIWRRVRNGDLGSCWIVITDVVRDLNIFTPSDASSLIIYLTTPPYLEDRRLAIRRWSSVWQMRISHSKCNTHNRSPPCQQQKIDNHNDTVVIPTSSAKPTSARILRCFLSRNPANRAFKVYVRPLLEYAPQPGIRHPNYRTRKRPTRLHKTNPRCSYLATPSASRSSN